VAEGEGFLGRWSRRKAEVREGKVVQEPAPEPAAPQPAAPAEALAPAPAAPPAAEPVAADPPPTLEDVKSLTPSSDFRRFIAADVTPQVKNAAMKKLFADPHFNVMDGMDVYIDDYSKPDPIPAAMLKQLASADFLGLFREQARDDAEGQASRSVAQSAPPALAEPAGEPPSAVPPPDDADPDLRLQQDDAAGRGEPGPGAG